jgi:hypothetical protein
MKPSQQNSAQTGACACFSAPHEARSVVKWLGMDARYRDATILACLRCGQLWLKLHDELEAFTASGRWYLGAITPEQAARLTAAEAQDALEGLSWYFFGGSYFAGQTGKTAGKINNHP